MIVAAWVALGVAVGTTVALALVAGVRHVAPPVDSRQAQLQSHVRVTARPFDWERHEREIAS